MTAPTNHPDDLSRLLQSVYPSIQPPPDFAEALLGKVQEAFDAGLTGRPAGFWIGRWWWLSAAAAACLAVAIGAALFYRHGDSRPSPAANALAPSTATMPAPALGIVEPAYAFFSSIWNVNGWDADRLEKQGITVRPVKPGIGGEDPPLEWVQVSFDCSRLPKDQPVVMTAWIVSEGRTITTIRAERNAESRDTMSLVFSVQPEYRDQSRLDIFIWRDTPDGKAADGYTLSMKRIMELARGDRGPQLPAPAGALAQAPPTTRPASPRGVTMGMLSEAQSLGRVSLIVRTRVAGWDHGIIRHGVDHVIYGDFAERTLLVDYTGIIDGQTNRDKAEAARELGHDPSPAEFESYILKQRGIEKGKEMILCLNPRPGQPGQPQLFLHYGSHFDVPPEHRLDDVEARMVRMIADGSYLSPSFPQPADVLEEHIRASDLIVRAELVQVTDTDSRWTILESIKGEGQKKTLIILHDLFRLRAQAIARHRQRTTQPGSQPTVQEKTAAETKRLIEAELTPKRQAILFLTTPKTAGESIEAHLRQRIYEDDSGKRLDTAKEAIQAAESHQLPVQL